MNLSQSARSTIVKCLGGIWILDGLLQLQPKMFGADFINNVLVPNLSNQPHVLHSLIAFGIYAWSLHPALANTAAALIQILIGTLLFFPSSSKALKTGLYLSLVWGLIVWIFGEGMGLLFTGTASFYTGAPGAVLLYVLLAILLLMSERVKSLWFPRIAGLIFVLGSLLQLQKNFWTADGIQQSIMASMMEPVHALSAAPTFISNILSSDPVLGNALLACTLFIVGMMLLLKPNRTTAVIALIFLCLVWWWGQDFGMLSTLFAGTSTDPNAAPLLALFILPLFFNHGMQQQNQS